MGLAFVEVGTALTTLHIAAAGRETWGGLYLGNILTDSAVFPRVDVAVLRGAATVYLARNILVPYGTLPLVVIPRLALAGGDALQVIASEANSVTATYSYQEELTA